MTQAEREVIAFSGVDDTSQQSPYLTSVLIVDDEPGIRSFVQKGLEKHFGLVEVAGDADTADALRQRCHFDLIIADIRLPGRSGVEWVTELREQGSSTVVIFITAHADLQTAIDALRAGAADFIMKPFRMEQLLAAVERCMERQRMQRENFVLRRQVDQLYDGAGMVGECEQIKKVCQVIKRIAPMPSTVLIEGESGTGKELAARAIHELSGRTDSFVPVNCGAMSHELMESELFGHVKGSFTGAHQAREGLFSYANGGTLFLDEIGEMPMSMQTHLLRVLEERTIRPVGSNREIPVNVRVIAATNRDLDAEVQKGCFREDLFYRLNVVSIRMPTLRERLEDLPALVRHFATTLAADMGLTPPACSETEIEAMKAYCWPGNVRELKNVIERCLLLNSTPSQCLAGPKATSSQNAVEEGGDDGVLLEAVEKRHILKVLEMEQGNKSAAARRLGVSRKTLERKVQAWNNSH
jgi:DNA-binding NtrC family response regulator